jgi:hypothetical protein
MLQYFFLHIFAELNTPSVTFCPNVFQFSEACRRKLTSNYFHCTDFGKSASWTVVQCQKEAHCTNVYISFGWGALGSTPERHARAQWKATSGHIAYV